MEIEETSRRVYIGFPLGLGLLVTLMLFICCFFCCCLYWEKLQSLFMSYSSSSGSGSGFFNPQAHMQTDLASSHQKPALPVLMMKQNETRSLPVLMPGDEFPKFMAVACPCQHPRDESITIIQVRT